MLPDKDSSALLQAADTLDIVDPSLATLNNIDDIRTAFEEKNIEKIDEIAPKLAANSKCPTLLRSTRCSHHKGCSMRNHHTG